MIICILNAFPEAGRVSEEDTEYSQVKSRFIRIIKKKKNQGVLMMSTNVLISEAHCSLFH